MNEYQTYWLSIDKQIEELSSNGIYYTDKDTVENLLQTIGCYTINVYTFSYDKKFKYFGDEVDITYIHRLYNFDCELRNIIIDIATNIERRFKVYIGNYLGFKDGAKGHLIKKNFYNPNTHNKFISIVDENAKSPEPTKYYWNQEDENFYNNTNKFPVWLVCQQLTLTKLSKMYANLQNSIKKKIIQENYNNKDVTKSWIHVEGWLKGITEMRNICAHNDKLFDWRSTFKNPFGLPKINEYDYLKDNPKSLFTALVISKLLMNDKYTVNNYDWSIFIYKLEDCISRYSFDNNFNPLDYMGFPSDWKERLLKY